MLFSKRAVLAGLAAVGLVAIAAPFAQADKSKWPKSITVGTASQGGPFFTYGSAWANIASEALGIPAGAEVTGGPTQNLALVHTGDLPFGMTTSGPARLALDGKSPLAPGVKMDKVRAIFPMYQSPFSITVLASSSVKTLADIPAGAKIGFGPSGSTSDEFFPLMLDTLGIKYERRNGSWNDLVSQMQDGLLDVVAFAAGVPVPALTQLEAQVGIRIISMTEAEQTKVMNAYPVLPFTIKAGTYKTLAEDSRAVSMWNFAIANADLPEDFVYEVVKAVMDNNAKLVTAHKAGKATINENVDKNTVIPWHKGALRYFEEKGIKIPDNLRG